MVTEEHYERIRRDLREVEHIAFRLRGASDQLTWLEFVMAYDRVRDDVELLHRAPARRGS